MAQTTLRNHLGLRTLSEILSERDEISHQIQHSLDEATEPWGVKVRLIGRFLPHWVKRGIKFFHTLFIVVIQYHDRSVFFILDPIAQMV